MTFALTKYIYPLEEQITISDNFGYVIDNPRTDDEITIVRDFINKTLTATLEDNDSHLDSLIYRYGTALNELKRTLSSLEPDSYALKYYNENVKKTFINIIAETWIIIRFDVSEEFEKIFKNKNELLSLLIADTKTSYSSNFEQLANYSHLISLLINDEDPYNGKSFLLQQDPYEIFFSSYNERIYEAVNHTILFYYNLKKENRATDWLYWIDENKNLLLNCRKLDTLLVQDKKIESSTKTRASQKQTPKEKLMHIGSLLRTSHSHHKNPKLMLLLLVSIIEFLITRNPETNKFNVEDSINKQFKLKCAILIHNSDKKYDLQKLNAELNEIYSQRSNFAHGNYIEKFNSDSVIELISKLYLFLNYILNEFISDRDLIDYLKDN